jgi:hypothetical protein
MTRKNSFTRFIIRLKYSRWRPVSRFWYVIGPICITGVLCTSVLVICKPHWCWCVWRQHSSDKNIFYQKCQEEIMMTVYISLSGVILSMCVCVCLVVRLFVCLSICLFVNKISQKVLDSFQWNVMILELLSGVHIRNLTDGAHWLQW